MTTSNKPTSGSDKPSALERLVKDNQDFKNGPMHSLKKDTIIDIMDSILELADAVQNLQAKEPARDCGYSHEPNEVTKAALRESRELFGEQRIIMKAQGTMLPTMVPHSLRSAPTKEERKAFFEKLTQEIEMGATWIIEDVQRLASEVLELLADPAPTTISFGEITEAKPNSFGVWMKPTAPVETNVNAHTEALKAENQSLQAKVAKLEAMKAEQDSTIKKVAYALEEAIKDRTCSSSLSYLLKTVIALLTADAKEDNDDK